MTFDNGEMPKDRGGRATSAASVRPAGPDDHSLIERIRNRDDAALRVLMERYDRLVRYAIFRTARRQCLRDPQWLDAVASDCWTGLLQSLRRQTERSRPSLPGFLTTIARNQTITAMRRIQRQGIAGDQSVSIEDPSVINQPGLDPSELLSDIDSLDLLRRGLDQLSEADRALVSQLDAITQRRWTDAAKALGLSESTLRSRWKRVLGLLTNWMGGRTGDFVAPEEQGGD